MVNYLDFRPGTNLFDQNECLILEAIVDRMKWRNDLDCADPFRSNVRIHTLGYSCTSTGKEKKKKGAQNKVGRMWSEEDEAYLE
jgi:hypothetical protein